VTVGIVLVQLISNDKFKSVTHRVLANQVGPRISVACFFGPQQLGNRLYGPVKELLSDDNPPLYREILVRGNTLPIMPRMELANLHLLISDSEF
jgi:hypothetical protein